MENDKAPQADYDRLAEEIGNLTRDSRVTVTPPPWATSRTRRLHEIPIITGRHPRHKHPALTWHRTEPTTQEGELLDQSTQSTMLTILGIGPRNLGQTLRRNGIQQQLINPQILDTIRRETRETAFRAFTRQARWDLEDKHGPQGTGPAPRW